MESAGGDTVEWAQQEPKTSGKREQRVQKKTNQKNKGKENRTRKGRHGYNKEVNSSMKCKAKVSEASPVAMNLSARVGSSLCSFHSESLKGTSE